MLKNTDLIPWLICIHVHAGTPSNLKPLVVTLVEAMARSKQFIDGLVWRLRTLGAPKVPNHAFGIDLANELSLQILFFVPFIGYPSLECMGQHWNLNWNLNSLPLSLPLHE